MPKFKHKNVKRKSAAAAAGAGGEDGKPKRKEKKEYTPFPPANHIPKRKVMACVCCGASA